MSKKKTNSTKYDAIAEEIRTKIMNGQYIPGARIPSEVRLSKLFNTTPVTASKALNILTEEGLLIRRRVLACGERPFARM